MFGIKSRGKNCDKNIFRFSVSHIEFRFSADRKSISLKNFTSIFRSRTYWIKDDERKNSSEPIYFHLMFYLYVDIIKDVIYIYKTQDMYLLMRKERGRSFDSCPMRKFGYKRFLSNDLFSPTGQPRNEIGKVDFINDHTGT